LTLGQHKFLADETIHPAVIAFLSDAGYSVVTVRGVVLAGCADGVILEHAFQRSQVILTHDSDFGKLAIAAGQSIYGIVVKTLSTGFAGNNRRRDSKKQTQGVPSGSLPSGTSEPGS
jgi:predicted nuclease of predicted toxin-antitoxin system